MTGNIAENGNTKKNTSFIFFTLSLVKNETQRFNNFRILGFFN